MAEINQKYGSYTALTLTSLNSMASDVTEPYLGWQSDKIDLQTSLKCLDVEIMIELAAVNTAPANDKAVYVYIAPCWTTDGGTTWKYCDPGYGTDLLDGTVGTVNIGANHNMILLGVLNYNYQNMVLNGTFMLSSIFQYLPDGFQIVIHNAAGFTIAASGNIVAYKPITQLVA